jgi:hypothetical protein
MQNLGNVYICGSPFVMSRTDVQNGLDIKHWKLCVCHRWIFRFRSIGRVLKIWGEVSKGVRCAEEAAAGVWGVIRGGGWQGGGPRKLSIPQHIYMLGMLLYVIY